jgi:hypothetical protein
MGIYWHEISHEEWNANATTEEYAHYRSQIHKKELDLRNQEAQDEFIKLRQYGFFGSLLSLAF